MVFHRTKMKIKLQVKEGIQLCAMCDSPFFFNSKIDDNIVCSHCGTVYNKEGTQIGALKDSIASINYIKQKTPGG